MSANIFRLFLVMTVFALSVSARAFDPKNFNELYKQLGFTAMQVQTRTKKPRIAILDNGFTGYADSIGKSLPADTQYISGPVAVEALNAPHGLFMAEILMAFMTNLGTDEDLAPELYLIEASGFTNFASAIDTAINLDVDIILHSMVWEYGGNFDGRGFLNAEVKRATNSGILWVNAAGNFNGNVFNLTNFTTDKDSWVKLPGPNSTLSFKCNPQGEEKKCPLRLVLTWNEFQDTTDKGTDKDLDLVLFDDTLNIIQGSYLVQTTAEELSAGQSKYPREIIETQVDPGNYLIKIKNRSNNFSRPSRARVSGSGDGIEFVNGDTTETIHPPADLPEVISVGAWDADLSSKSKANSKPDLLSPSILDFGNNEVYAGSSNAAAMVAAAIGLLVWDKTSLTRQEAIQILGNGKKCDSSLSLNRRIPDYVKYVLSTAPNSLLVESQGKTQILVTYDPFQLSRRTQKSSENDKLYITANGYMAFGPNSTEKLSSDVYEIVQRTDDMNVCNAGVTVSGPAKRNSRESSQIFLFQRN